MEDDERKYFWGRVPSRNYVSKRFGTSDPLRYFYKTSEGQDSVAFARVEDDIVLQQGPRDRSEVRATVVETDRGIKRLVIQRFSKENEPHKRDRFAFVGSQIDALKRFFAGINTVPLDSQGAKSYISDADLAELMLNNAQLHQLITKRPDLARKIAESEDLSEDLIAVGYRRTQMKAFERMIEEGRATEAQWQAFFERNRWIFGYGLSYQFLSGLDGRALETIVRGADVTGAGKRADGLMKTRGRIGSLCFVEIKLPGTPLLQSKPYRSGSWATSAELAGAVAQVQNTVNSAAEQFRRQRLQPTDAEGNPTGEDLFVFEPKSVLVVGNLDQFMFQERVNVDKFRSFELYRRNTWRPEVITFDELLERARFIVEHGQIDLDEMAGRDNGDDDIPF